MEKSAKAKRVRTPIRDATEALRVARIYLEYDSESGVFTNKASRTSNTVIGAVATCKAGNGYLGIHLEGRQYHAHRVAWLWHYGRWPDGVIDHINGDRSDNRIRNLRDVSIALNGQNRFGPQKNNKSGFLGVMWNKAAQKYAARIRYNGKFAHLGFFDDPVEASKAYMAAKREKHAGAYLNTVHKV